VAEVFDQQRVSQENGPLLGEEPMGNDGQRWRGVVNGRKREEEMVLDYTLTADGG
jgi:hypothetical protein